MSLNMTAQEIELAMPVEFSDYTCEKAKKSLD